MSNVSFKRGLSTALNSLGIVDGQLIVCTDTKELYTDVGANRLKISNVEIVSNMQSLPAVASAIKGKFYYTEAENVFCFPYNGEWKQVNPDTGATSVEFVGSGNAVTDASYDAVARKITLTKGETFATKAAVDTIQATIDDVVEAATAELNYTAEGAGAGKTIASLTQVDGQIAATFEDISITKSQISDFAHNHDDMYYTEAEINAKVAALEEADTALSDKIGTIPEGSTATNLIDYVNQKVADVASSDTITDLAGRVEAVEGEIDALQTATAEGGAVSNAIADAKKAGTDAQAAVDALEEKVGEVPTNKTVVGLISEAKAQADKGVNDAAAAKAAADAAQEDIDAFLASAEVGEAAIDTLKEIQDYITSDGQAAATMTANIAALQEKVDTGDQKVSEYVADAIAALNIGDYAKAADLTALAARVTATEGEIDVLQGQIETINGDANTAGSIAKAAADTLASAKSYADGLDTAMDARVQVVENKAHEHTNKALLDTYTQTEANLADAVAKKHEHENADVLDGITAAKVSAWDAAQGNAEATAAAALEAAKTELKGSIATKADKATTLAGYGITNAYTKTEVDALVNEALVWGEF